MTWELTLPMWKWWICFSLVFFFGYAVAAILFISSGRKSNAKVLGDVGREAEGKHDQSRLQDPTETNKTVVVGEILEKKTKTRRTSKATGSDKREV